MSKAPFRFPIAAGDIMTFCHPSPASGLDQPHFVDGDLHAGNGHIAVRARRGLWMESDYQKPDHDFTARLSNLPWHSFPDLDSNEWRNLDDVRGDIYARGVIGVWHIGMFRLVQAIGSPLLGVPKRFSIGQLRKKQCIGVCMGYFQRRE